MLLKWIYYTNITHIYGLDVFVFFMCHFKLLETNLCQQTSAENKKISDKIGLC